MPVPGSYKQNYGWAKFPYMIYVNLLYDHPNVSTSHAQVAYAVRNT